MATAGYGSARRRRRRAFRAAIAAARILHRRRQGRDVPDHLIARGRRADWHPPALVEAAGANAQGRGASWVWWRLAPPPCAQCDLADIVERAADGVKWHTAAGDEAAAVADVAGQRGEGRGKAKASKALSVGARLSANAADATRRQGPASRSAIRRHRRLPAHAGRRLVAPDHTGRRGAAACARGCCRRARRRG